MVKTHFVDIGIKLHLREWAGHKKAFVLLHGLASNSQTWSVLAGHLATAGHRVITVDQRGHGLSDKPDDGYGFTTITGDLAQLLQTLQLERPVLVGQSWGGNVLLEFGARYPGAACGLGFIDGGFLDLQSRPGATWESVAAELKPPNLLGRPRVEMEARLKAAHPDWDRTAIQATLANFETLPDGTIRPWLTLPRHLAILRAMWEQRPQHLYAHITEPVLICAARDSKNPDWTKAKSRQVAAAQSSLARSMVHWLDDTDHDIHVHRPNKLAEILLDTVNNGIWRECNESID